MTVKNESLIHVKLEYGEAIQSKRDILSSVRDLIRLLKVIKRYHALRKEELDLKINIFKKIKDLKADLAKLTSTLPKIKIPDILIKENPKEEKTPARKKEYPDRDLESQLQEIQEKLRR